MKKQNLSEANFELWLSLGEVSHSIVLARKRELDPNDPSVRQFQILHAIQDLGLKATISQVAQKLQREIHVISRHTIIMEQDGLIKRIRSSPKSTLLKLELTEKALDILQRSRPSKIIDTIFSSLSKAERQNLESILKKISAEVKKHTPDQRIE
jgi:DNA-binding MarR family transcriptional regulator